MATAPIVRDLQARIDELKKRREAIDEELKLLEQMADLPAVQEQLSALGNEGLGPGRTSVDSTLGEEVRRGRPASSIAVWRLIVEILEERGEPMRLEALAEAIVERRGPFGGHSRLSTVASNITQHRQYLRQRGGYAYLARWLD